MADPDPIASNANCGEASAGQCEAFSIGPWCRGTNQFNTDLGELAVGVALRAFIPKDRASIADPQW
jgi:hypothetical protein